MDPIFLKFHVVLADCHTSSPQQGVEKLNILKALYQRQKETQSQQPKDNGHPNEVHFLALQVNSIPLSDKPQPSYLSQDDRNGLQLFMSSVISILIPHMSRMVEWLEEQVAPTRKTLKNSIKGIFRIAKSKPVAENTTIRSPSGINW